MNKKRSTALRIVLGVYLTFIGGQLMYDVVTEKPTDLTLKCAMAAVFIIIGVGYTIWSIHGAVDFSQWKKKKDTEPEDTKDKKVYRRPVTDKTTYRTAPMPTQQEMEAELRASEAKESGKASEKASAKKKNVTVDLTIEEESEERAEASPTESKTEKGEVEETLHRADGAEAEERISESDDEKVQAEDTVTDDTIEIVKVPAAESTEKKKASSGSTKRTKNNITVYPGSMKENEAVRKKAGEKKKAEDVSRLAIEIEDITDDETPERKSPDIEIEENDYEEK